MSRIVIEVVTSYLKDAKLKELENAQSKYYIYKIYHGI